MHPIRSHPYVFDSIEDFLVIFVDAGIEWFSDNKTVTAAGETRDDHGLLRYRSRAVGVRESSSKLFKAP